MNQKGWPLWNGGGAGPAWGLGGLVLAWTAALAGAMDLTTVELYSQAGVRGPEIRLADVARIDGPAAAELSQQVVARFAGGSGLQLTLADVERVLEQSAAHRGLIVVRGYSICRVTRAPAEGQDRIVAGNAQANPQEEVAIDGNRSGGTLRRQVEDLLRRMAGSRAEELEIHFAEAEERQLNQAVGSRRVEIQPQSQVFPGRIPLVIRLRGPEGTWQAIRLTAEVGWRTEAVVLKRGLSRGQVISQDDLELRPVVIRAVGQPVRDVEAAVGKAAKGVLRAGTILLQEHLEPAALVRRGELVTVRCRQGSLVVTTVGRAMEDGVLHQMIEVRNEKSRQSFLARVSGSGEVLVSQETETAAGTVKEGEPMARYSLKAERTPLREDGP